MTPSVTFRIEEGSLYISLLEKITTDNATEMENAIIEIRQEHPELIPVIDASELSYMSSAGLRVLLRFRRREPQLSVINVGIELYEILEMTGFTEMMPVRKAYRRIDVTGCEVIGRGVKGTVYRYDAETVIKIYNDPECISEINRERELSRKAFVLGIPTAIPFDVVRVGDTLGSVFELLNAKSFSQIIAEEPSRMPELTGIYASLLRQIHSTQVKEEDMPDAKLTPLVWVNDDRPALAAEDADKLECLIRELPDRMTMIQGDYHTNNLMMQGDETLLIDLDTLSRGHPILDLVNVYFTYKGMTEVDPDNSVKFLGIPAKIAEEMWQRFLPDYLQSDDPVYIARIEEKIRLLSYARMLRHIKRRDSSSESIEYCSDSIHRLLQTTETLDF